MFGKNVLRSSGLLPENSVGGFRPTCPARLLGEEGSHWWRCLPPALPLACGAHGWPHATVARMRSSWLLPLVGRVTHHAQCPWKPRFACL